MVGWDFVWNTDNWAAAVVVEISSSEAEQVHAVEEAVDAGVGLTSHSHESGKSDGLLLSIDLSILINL